jgi:hypothetical protein
MSCTGLIKATEPDTNRQSARKSARSATVTMPGASNIQIKYISLAKEAQNVQDKHYCECACSGKKNENAISARFCFCKNNKRTIIIIRPPRHGAPEHARAVRTAALAYSIAHDLHCLRRRHVLTGWSFDVHCLRRGQVQQWLFGTCGSSGADWVSELSQAQVDR